MPTISSGRAGLVDFELVRRANARVADQEFILAAELRAHPGLRVLHPFAIFGLVEIRVRFVPELRKLQGRF